MNHIDQIPGCFGTRDQIFAGHPLDEKRAFELLKYCRENKISLEGILDEIKRHLESEKCGKPHIKEQLDSVRTYFGPWLQA